jgi:hypothetical protein
MSGGGAPRSLKADELALLREVLERRAPDLLSLLAKAGANTLDRNERLRLCELIGAEFAETGVGADSEPLPRGVKLEALLDLINRPNLFPDR